MPNREEIIRRLMAHGYDRFSAEEEADECLAAQETGFPTDRDDA